MSLIMFASVAAETFEKCEVPMGHGHLDRQLYVFRNCHGYCLFCVLIFMNMILNTLPCQWYYLSTLLPFFPTKKMFRTVIFIWKVFVSTITIRLSFMYFFTVNVLWVGYFELFLLTLYCFTRLLFHFGRCQWVKICCKLVHNFYFPGFLSQNFDARSAGIICSSSIMFQYGYSPFEA